MSQCISVSGPYVALCVFFYKIADFVTIGKWELKQRGWELVINREVGHMELLVEVLLEKLRL